MRRSFVLVAAALAAATVSPAAAQDTAPACAPGADPVAGRVDISPADARSYQLVPFDVTAGTTTIQIAYDWGNASPFPGTQFTSTTVDLGVWDQDGYRSTEGFRGWGGSRHKDVTIAADEATRNFTPAPVEAGIWWLEFGIGGVSPDGGWYAYAVECLNDPVGPAPAYDPVDPTHVANPSPGWYQGDFHMHGFQSNPNAPTYDVFVDFARSQGLDFFPLTEYVVGVHWGQLGPFQRANPDVLFWPGREIITYYGHVTQFGATPGALEYRHGFEDVTIAGIVDDARAAGALLGIAHPTSFEQPGFESFCRGCPWELADQVAWDRFTTFEVAQGPQVVKPDPRSPAGFENPFTQTAIDLWTDLLNRGVFLTAVGASDDKVSGQGSGPTYTPHGVPATAVYADALAVEALAAAVQSGRAYVRTRGVAESPSVDVTVTTPDGAVGMMGDTLVADEADVVVTVSGGANQGLRVFRDGSLVDLRPIPGDDFTHTFTASRDAGSSSPLGTWWRFETFDELGRTTITNPFFLDDEPRAIPEAPPPTPTPDPAPEPEPEPAPLPATGAGVAGLALVAALAGTRAGRR